MKAHVNNPKQDKEIIKFLSILLTELKFLKELNENLLFAFEEISKLLKFEIAKKHKEFNKILKSLKVFLHSQINTFNIKEIKKKINIYVNDLRKLSRELSLMAINTKIKSVNMGEKGTTISVLSTEIKKAAELQNEFSSKFEEELSNVSTILEKLIKAFEKIYEDFETLVKDYQNSIKVDNLYIDKEYILKLEQYIKKLEKLKSDFEKSNTINKYAFKKLLSELNEFLQEYKEYVENITSNLKKLFENFKNIQKFLSKSHFDINSKYDNIMELINKFHELILKIIKNLYFIENFSKTIENLRVLMSIEVNRIQAVEFYSIVEAMNKVKEISDKAQIEMQKLFLQ
ncbi:MAG TPA: hypothetical protein EYP03_00625 [Aquificae bacterium]|nr:hypothetical protein [Aquificota bacterium]